MAIKKCGISNAGNVTDHPNGKYKGCPLSLLAIIGCNPKINATNVADAMVDKNPAAKEAAY